MSSGSGWQTASIICNSQRRWRGRSRASPNIRGRGSGNWQYWQLGRCVDGIGAQSLCPLGAECEMHIWGPMLVFSWCSKMEITETALSRAVAPIFYSISIEITASLLNKTWVMPCLCKNGMLLATARVLKSGFWVDVYYAVAKIFWVVSSSSKEPIRLGFEYFWVWIVVCLYHPCYYHC